MASMYVLVTGGLGVIGSVLVRMLRAKGYKVIVSDKHILKLDGYMRGDVTRYEELLQIFKQYEIKHVFHLAGEVGRINGEEFPRRCIEINESGTINLAQLCLEFGATLYFASTSEIYGELGEMSLTEDLSEKIPLKPTNVYALSKLNTEYYLKHFVQNYGLNAVVFRFFTCYGPGEFPTEYRSAMANFIRCALTEKQIVVHRGTKRGWCYIEDTATGCILAMEKAPKGVYSVYNIGSGDLRTMEDVARTICKVAGKSESLIHLVEPPKQFLSIVKNPSFAKAEKELGFKAAVPLNEGIRMTIEWQKKIFAQGGS